MAMIPPNIKTMSNQASGGQGSVVIIYPAMFLKG